MPASSWKLVPVPQDSSTITRRAALVALMLGLLAAQAPAARAEDGGGGGGDGGSDGGGDDGGDGGSDDGGGDDSGSDDSGSDDGGSDDGGSDDGDKDSDDGSKARDAVRSGDAASLKDILAEVRKKYQGKVVRVQVSGTGSKLVYKIRLLDAENRVVVVRVDARSRRIIGSTATLY